jgi:hypothetical protein
MHREESTVQLKEHVFSFALKETNTPVLSSARYESRRLRFRRNRVKNMNASDPASQYQRAQRSNHSFDFRKLRHEVSGRSRRRLESERVFSCARLCGVAERREDGFAFVPVRELIGIVAASRLTGLSGRNQ